MRTYFKELKMNLQRIAKSKANIAPKEKKFKEDKPKKEKKETSPSKAVKCDTKSGVKVSAVKKLTAASALGKKKK